MKILISNDGPHAHFYIRRGLARAFSQAGHQVYMWELGREPVNDVFDKFEPDIFWGQSYNLTESMVRAILERPALRVILRAGEWSPHGYNLNPNEYPLLLAKQQDIDLCGKLKDAGRLDYLQIHYHPDYLSITHEFWLNNGFVVKSHLNAADIFDFHPIKNKDEMFECDGMFLGGYWPYKAKVIDKWLMPIVRDLGVHFKIFGNANWPTEKYCGYLPDEYAKLAIGSAKVCPNLHEPHSHAFGYDIVERPFKLLACGAFVISDYVEGLAKLIPEGIVYAKTPEEFQQLFFSYLHGRDDEKESIRKTGFNTVIRCHTYFNRVRDVFDNLQLYHQAMNVENIIVNLEKKYIGK